MKTAAVIPSRGIGDALLMMVASHRLHTSGFEVTTYHTLIGELAPWFPDHSFDKLPPLEEFAQLFTKFNLIILQNDGSDTCLRLIELYRRGTLRNLSVFYPSFSQWKHPQLTMWDRVFSPTANMVSNIATSISSVLQSREISTNNGIRPPQGREHRKHLHRVVIHPSSYQENDRWLKPHFFDVARVLKKRGFEVVFAVSPSERARWVEVTARGFCLPHFENLSRLAECIYESGYVIGNDSAIGHLASNLKIPTVIVANCYKKMRLWRPGWLKGDVITPSRLIPNLKHSRLRERQWQYFISPKKVLKKFRKLVFKDNIIM